ncbi:MAG: bifunctional riboflavin kinase/FAD synthetase [Candidatus Omnitrophica bacterium]|nr:bifunctional riboflavin kinase/FAD synthetase [Candidatus Omnitrophota bacterium]
MKVIYGLTRFKTLNKKPAVALGVFDGMHRGHRRIISRLKKEARRIHAKSLVVTFFPHPQKESALYSLSHRLRLLEELGVELCLVIRFTHRLRIIPAEKFLLEVIIKKINPAVVLIGKNFTFGKQARGDWRMLRDYSSKIGFKLVVADILMHKGKPVSSSWIRKLIKSGDLLKVRQLLGRPVTIFGKINKGSGLGRELGYPTANILPEHDIIPPFGVYAVRVRLALRRFKGACYIGSKPTVNNSGKISIEVHILDFHGNLYGQRTEVEFIKRIRQQKKFNSIQGLASQIGSDIRNCRRLFKAK